MSLLNTIPARVWVASPLNTYGVKWPMFDDLLASRVGISIDSFAFLSSHIVRVENKR